MSLCDSDWKMAQARRYLLQRRARDAGFEFDTTISKSNRGTKYIQNGESQQTTSMDFYYSLPSKQQAGFSCHFVCAPITATAKSCPVRRSPPCLRSRPDASGVSGSPKYHDLLSHYRSHHAADRSSPFLIFSTNLSSRLSAVLRTSLRQASPASA
jgi:hypothetical protein